MQHALLQLGAKERSIHHGRSDPIMLRVSVRPRSQLRAGGSDPPDLLIDGKVQIGPQSPYNGIQGDARRSTAALGKLAFDMKVDYAVRQIRSLLPTK